ncbi:MAG: hypothetical protein Q8J85_04805 [Sulfuricurvum sp.]|nr:hypothetical protein [Sulfuricurvum sp.]MDP3022725.1 hypothetical protein [Sulfuricurvum sp.]
MNKIILGLLLICISLVASDNSGWPFACEQPSLAKFTAERYFPIGTISPFPLISADTQTIQIDRKNKIIKVWLIWMASEQGRQLNIQYLGKVADYSNFGYNIELDVIDYDNMRVLIKSTTHYNCDASVIYPSSSGEWEDIRPASVMEGITQKIKEKYNL